MSFLSSFFSIRPGGMIKEKKRKDTTSDCDVAVYVAPTIVFLHGQITEVLCNEVFQNVRTAEGQRKWTSFALARPWLAVIVSPVKARPFESTWIQPKSVPVLDATTV